MSDEGYSIQELLVLRKLTVAASKLLTEQMKEYLATLAPLLRPKAVLGDYVDSSTKEAARGADRNFKELQSLYEAVATAKPFNLPAELKPPIEIVSATLEFTPLEYSHAANAGGQDKTVTVTSPLTWVLNYSGFSLGRLRELVSDRSRSGKELKEFVLHYLVLHVVISRQKGITDILNALHFPISANERAPGLGELPITYVRSTISTIRPPDNVIIESTDISGRDVFEEVINIDDIVKLHDPLKDRLIEIVSSHGRNLPPQFSVK